MTETAADISVEHTVARNNSTTQQQQRHPEHEAFTAHHLEKRAKWVEHKHRRNKMRKN